MNLKEALARIEELEDQLSSVRFTNDMLLCEMFKRVTVLDKLDTGKNGKDRLYFDMLVKACLNLNQMEQMELIKALYYDAGREPEEVFTMDASTGGD